MPTFEDWNASDAAVIRELIREVLAGAGGVSPLERDVARRTGGLPVYCDIGGCLVISSEGDVLEFAFADDRVTGMLDGESIRLARAIAAERYPQLSKLRPVDGELCTACAGTGRLEPFGVRCGECQGTGYRRVK